MDNDITQITLIDEDGVERNFQVVTKMDIENKEYVVVVPEESNDSEAIILRIDKDSDGNDVLVTVEDDNEFNVVSEAYETLFSEDDMN
ncbi:uncharacterized protein YrzB (UPF0473 family) [Clostridium acetobutylicum]|uniref:UPF0473 protein CA_C1681 n=1 Tax=Clostridium acetobutylicum (strain ATCC 824 / DSM 792 / JCM 1419 / IAM 19013 / LMG 5710 / NBRC 13948 / NRRL B-527 / VKM B-1787 / 2291 / W) TaxID=272562 RepID=Q97IG0_CLOAB|nr:MULTISPECIES: DUF1292 domain-containing protein [Clostridium]AAK79647.1 Hypothetical protein CA_C1681 [Clostridium acetobutylicum ATCC 824]ADZ20731.1 Conserved hypothetical protein [Clostridium acetobutylicum EA 2018]AEI31942.1 hypothetical protein SMB_G1706 [Clostridium acetobutylicum DSM 1731]AWV79917.1 DUF1292 domain-containing protein [Clostridium acetobutylicum]KHD37978.1 hypothetical protein NL50_00260 [Clostridium acetobutylicum]